MEKLSYGNNYFRIVYLYYFSLKPDRAKDLPKCIISLYAIVSFSCQVQILLAI